MLVIKINIDKETSPGSLAKIVDLLKEYELEAITWERSGLVMREAQAVRQAQQRDV